MTTYLEDLAEDLLNYQAAQVGRQRKIERHAAPRATAKDLRTLALLRTETTRVAALVAAATSFANAASRAGRGPGAMDQMPFAPAFPQALDAQVASLADNEIYFDLQQLWLAANGKLAFAKELGAARAAEFDRPIERQVLHADVLADAWCRVCAVIRDFLIMIQHLMAEQGVTISPLHEPQSVALLEDAALGRSPCIASDGSFSLPGWAERRRERRHHFVQSVQLSIGIKSYAATTVDVSQNGMQIANNFSVPTRTRVALHMDDGRRLDATVSWSDGKRTGLIFAEPLGNDDPLWSATNA